MAGPEATASPRSHDAEGSTRASRVLLVEDDQDLALKVEAYLKVHGYEVVLEGRGDRALGRAVACAPDLVVLDVLLPGKDGLSVCRELREIYEGPILMLTGMIDEADEVVGLEMGADDYVGKPFRLRLLLARIRALLRRAESRVKRREPAARGRVLDTGSIVIDTLARTARIGTRELDLTTLEFELLSCLASCPGTPLARSDLHERVRGVEWDGLDRSIDNLVSKLRVKLRDDGKHPAVLKSVRGTGYVLVPAET